MDCIPDTGRLFGRAVEPGRLIWILGHHPLQTPTSRPSFLSLSLSSGGRYACLEFLFIEESVETGRGGPPARRSTVCVGCPLLVGFQQNQATPMFHSLFFFLFFPTPHTATRIPPAFKRTNVSVRFPIKSQLPCENLSLCVCVLAVDGVVLKKDPLPFSLERIQNS